MTSTVASNHPIAVRSPQARLVLLVAAVAAFAWIEVSLLVDENVTALSAVMLVPLTGLVYAAAGAVAVWRRPANRLGAIMVTAAMVILVDGLAATDVPELAAVGVIVATVPLAFVVHLLHAFPSGRIRSAVSRWTVGAGYAVCLVLQVPLYLFSPGASPHGMLTVADRPGVVAVGSWVQIGAGVAVMLATAVILGGRMWSMRPPRRRVLAPLYLYGIVAVLLVPIVPDLIRPLAGMSETATMTAQTMVLAAVPVAFVCAVLLGGFARTSEIQELGAWLGATAADRPRLVDALAAALGDRSVQLAFWVPSREAYVDVDGIPVMPPAMGSGRAAVDVEIGERRVGAIFYDETLIDDPELVRAAGRVIAIAADQKRLAAELRASERRLQDSRSRIVEAGDRERRRIAQDLHDGLQSELVLLALEAQRIATQPGVSASAAEAAGRLHVRLDQAAAGLRELVYAVMPAPLIERGMAAALDDLADRMPLPTALHLDLMPDDSVPASVQSTAYFVVAEALSNAVKHASAEKVTVRVRRGPKALFIDVDDDGVGGALPGAGLGLRGLADRVDVLGGHLHIDSPACGGTHIAVELPCAS